MEPDTWNNWAEGIRQQYHKKHQARYHPYSNLRNPSSTSNHQNSSESTNSSPGTSHPKIDPKRIKNFNDELKIKYKKSENASALEARLKYEEESERFFHRASSDASEISYYQIPWPFPPGGRHEDARSFLFGHLEEGSKEFQAVLKRNQVRWHPDRFMHRCGGRIRPSDETAVTATVKALSQLFNGLSNDPSLFKKNV